MPEGSRRFWRDDVLAGAWRWRLVILFLLLIVPLPGPSRLHARSAAYVSKSSAAAAAVRFALDQLGKRYRWGGAGPMAYDCSGLTMMAYRSAGVRIPRVSRWQYEVGQRIPVRQLVAGDLVFYARNPANPSTIDHVGMYLGGGRMVEAANRSVPIRIASIWRPGLMRHGVRPAPSSPRSRAACAPPVPAWRWTAPSGPSRSPRCGASSAPTAWLPTGRSVAPPGPPLSATDASGADRRPAERSTSTTRSGRGAVRPDRVAQTPRGGSVPGSHGPTRRRRPTTGGFRGTNGQRRGQCGQRRVDEDSRCRASLAIPDHCSFVLGEAAPDAVALAVRQRVVGAPLAHAAAGADQLRCALPPPACGPAFPVRREEHRAGQPATGRLQPPRPEARLLREPSGDGTRCPDLAVVAALGAVEAVEGTGRVHVTPWSHGSNRIDGRRSAGDRRPAGGGTRATSAGAADRPACLRRAAARRRDYRPGSTVPGSTRHRRDESIRRQAGEGRTRRGRAGARRRARAGGPAPAERHRHGLLRARRELPAGAGRDLRLAVPAGGVQAGGRGGAYGGRLRQADRPAGDLPGDPRARRDQRQRRRPHRRAGLGADAAAGRSGRALGPRPGGVPGAGGGEGVRHHGQVDGRGRRPRANPGGARQGDHGGQGGPARPPPICARS